MTERIDLGAGRAEGGYFLLRGHQAKPFDAELRSQSASERFCFTYQKSRCSIEEELLAIVRSARRKIFITSFRIGDKRLFDALYEAAERLRGGVYVITALDENSLSEGLKELDELPGGGEAPTLDSLKANFADMTRRGIYVRGHSSCHAKFVVVDDEAALVSSANLETAALRGSVKRGATGECGVVLHNGSEVNRLARFFTRLWHEGCDWEIPAGVSYTVRKRSPTAVPCAVPMPAPSVSPGIIWTDGEKEPFILRTLQEIIGLARKELLLASFSLCEMRAHADLLLDPVATAIRERGVHVRMLVRGRNNVATHCEDAQRLADLGVEIIADTLNHAKGVIADGRHGALFSANFDAQHGLTNGVEAGVRLDGLDALQDARAYFDHAMDNADLRFVNRPTSRTLAGELAVGWRQRWTLPNEVLVFADDPVWWELAEAAREHVALFEQHSAEAMDIFCGKAKWCLRAPDSDGSSRLTLTEIMPVVSSRTLRSWMSEGSRRRKPAEAERAPGPARGICPAIFTRVERTNRP